MTLFGDRIMTPRLCLRKVETRDIPLLVAWSNRTAAHGLYLTPERASEEKIRRDHGAGTLWSERNKVFVIELREGTPIGTLHYWLRPENRKCAVVALKIAEPLYRGRGYGTEAQKYTIIYLLARMRLAAVEMYTDINNLTQQCCLRKLGFELVESLSYEDCHVPRTGHLFRIDADRFARTPAYHFYYE